jgi:hypothetical protein
VKKIFLSLFFVTLFSSCSRLDIAVGLASTYIVKKSNDYFDLTISQSKWVRSHFNTDFAKVKKLIFPQIAAEMIKSADIVSGQRNFTEIMVDNTFVRMKNLFYEGLRIFTGSAVAFVDQLTPAQISYFQKEFDQTIAESKEKSTQKNSYKRMKKNFDSWLGGMTSEQKVSLEKFTSTHPDPINEKIEHRKELSNEFAKTYPYPMQRKAFIENLFNKYETLYSAKFAKITKDRSKQTASFVASVLNSMTEDQRKTLIEALRERANQLIKISKD